MSHTHPTSPEASAKRRALLKGAGVAAAAGGTPLVAMATSNAKRLVTSTGKGGAHPVIMCSVSGWQSFQNAGTRAQTAKTFLSARPGDITCGGYSPGWWGQNNKTKAKRWSGGMATLADLPYTTALPGGTRTVGGKTATMWELMSMEEFAPHDDRHWLGAWLNARSNEVSYAYNENDNFPFTSQQVTGFYMEQNADALGLIKRYLETHEPQ